MPSNRKVVCPVVFAALVLVASPLFAQTQPPKKLDSITVQRVEQMLRDGYSEVKKNYYDKAYHNVDWDAKYHWAQENLKQINSLGQGFSTVAGMLMALDDSHTFFIPPDRPVRIEYGFHIQMIGDHAMITRVRPGTDAETKLHLGDEVLGYNRYSVDRASLWKLDYYFNRLSPSGESDLVLKDPSGAQREVKILAKTQQRKRVMDLTQGQDIWQLIREDENADHQVRQRYYESGDIMIWKMPEFDLDENEVDHMFGIVRKHKTLILDLRDNPGGSVKTLELVTGSIFDHDIKIADRIGRKDLKPQLAKAHRNPFGGKIIVLIDSNSASAAELLARVIQLEKRGTVLGDRSSGKVMESKLYSERQGADTQIFYSFSVTDANLLMADGNSLEHVGVVPDEILLPTGQDLAEGKDPVLAHAAELAGVTLTPVAAGKLFPYEWLPMSQ